MMLRKIVSIVIFSLLFSIILYSLTGASSAQSSCSTPEEDCFFVTETTHDPAAADVYNHKGYTTKSITAENRNVKVVWNYEPYDSHGNQGGGNIYELFDKRTDPLKQKNLVAEEAHGAASTGPPRAGIGGLGATYFYDLAFKGLLSDGPRSDNGGMARLAKDANGVDLPQSPPMVDEYGNVSLEIKLDVYDSLWTSGYRDGNVDPTHREYQITKHWVLHPDGQIDLDISGVILRDISISEPAYYFSFNEDYGWNNAKVLRHDFASCAGINSDGYLNEDNSEITYHISDDSMTDTNSSIKHAQSFKLDGHAGGTSVQLNINENNGGYEKSTGDSGLFDFGSNIWQGSVNETTSEMTVARGDLGNGVTMHWYGWWGGGNPDPSRYKAVMAGMTFHDSFVLRLSEMTNFSPLSARVFPGDNSRVSTDSQGKQVDLANDLPRISASGDLIVFASNATNLIMGDGNGKKDIFLKDVRSDPEQTLRISADSSGLDANGDSDNPTISGDGNYVVFSSLASNLIPGDNNNSRDVFLRDLRPGGQTVLVSTASNGDLGNGNSDKPVVTADDSYVYIAFESVASNLVTGDTRTCAGGINCSDIFVKKVPLNNINSGETLKVSADPSGALGNGNSYGAAISADSAHVSFYSAANNIVIGVGDEASSDYDLDVFRKSIITGDNQRVSTAISGEADGASSSSAISHDGQYVVFQSTASNLVLSDAQMCGTVSCSDIFLKNMTDGTTSMVSVNADGIPGNNASSKPTLSSDGRFIAFQSTSDNLITNDINGVQDIFVHDSNTGNLRCFPFEKDAWPGYAGSSSPSLSGNGDKLVFASDAPNLIRISKLDINKNQGYADTNEVRDIYSTKIDSYFDTVAPMLAFNAPTGTINTSSTTLQATYSDETPSSGSNVSSAILSIDGGRDLACIASEGSIGCPVENLSDGQHEAVVSLFDNAGNVGTVAGSFAVDTSIPSISSITPSSTIEAPAVTIIAAYADAVSGIDASSVQVALDGNVLNSCTEIASAVSCGVSGLINGGHLIDVSIRDNAGNSNSTSGFFSVSYSSPYRAISITDIINGKHCAAVGTWDSESKACTLNTDIQVVSGTNGFEIGAPGITLDGAGHSLIGSGSNFHSGVQVQAMNGVKIMNLNISLFTDGIIMASCPNATFTNNTIRSSRYGIWLGTASGAEVYNNNFMNCPIPITSTGSNNIFNQPSPLGGNYFSNYDSPEEGCSDSDQNRFCDAPYSFLTGQDALPWVGPDGWLSP